VKALLTLLPTTARAPPLGLYPKETSIQLKFQTSKTANGENNLVQQRPCECCGTWMAGVRYLVDLPGTRRPHKRRLRVGCWAADCTRSHALIQGEGCVFRVDCSFVLEICANDTKLCETQCSCLVSRAGSPHLCRQSSLQRATSNRRVPR
jgi:hypothetical protein